MTSLDYEKLFRLHIAAPLLAWLGCRHHEIPDPVWYHMGIRQPGDLRPVYQRGLLGRWPCGAGFGLMEMRMIKKWQGPFVLPISGFLALSLSILLIHGSALGEEIEVDLMNMPRIHADSGAVCDAQQMGDGSIRLTYNFLGSKNTYAHYIFLFPACKIRSESLS